MKQIALLSAFALTTAVASCGDTVLPYVPGSCPAPQLQDFVGEHESAATTIQYAGPMRVIRPGDIVTMDLIPARLNIRIGTDRLIAAVTCG